MIDTLKEQDTVYALTQTDEAVYAARASGLYRSTDEGKTWQNALASLGVGNIAVTDILSIAGQLFVGIHGGVLSSTNGETWHAVPFRKPLPTLSALAVSPNLAQDQTLFAASLEDGVFRSEDAGKTWTAWNMGLLDLRVLSFAITQDNHVYAGTETGLYLSKNAGRSWEAVALPFASDAVLSLLSVDEQLCVGTETNGVFKLVAGDWEGLELPRTGAVNQMLALPDGLLVLLDDAVYLAKGQTFEAWRGVEDVTTIALSKANQVLLGFGSGEVERANLG